MAVRREIERIERIAKVERDPQTKKALKELLASANRLLDAYSIDPPVDAREVVVMSAIVELFLKLEELRSKLDQHKH
jgi:hypothetical protein